MTDQFLFVYGTLLPKSNHPMSTWLGLNASIVCKGKFRGNMYWIDDYPGACFDAESSIFVYGTIFQFRSEDPILDVLDAYEEVGTSFSYPNEFIRIKMNIISEDYQDRNCWVYVYNRPINNLMPIHGGDFLSIHHP